MNEIYLDTLTRRRYVAKCTHLLLNPKKRNGSLDIHCIFSGYFYPRDDLKVSIGYRVLPGNMLIKKTSVTMGVYFE